MTTDPASTRPPCSTRWPVATPGPRSSSWATRSRPTARRWSDARSPTATSSATTPGPTPASRTSTTRRCAREFTRLNDRLVGLGLPRPNLWRPPYSAFNSRVDTVARNLGMTRTMFDVNTGDADEPGGVSVEETTRRAVEGSRAGSIVIMHDPLANSRRRHARHHRRPAGPRVLPRRGAPVPRLQPADAELRRGRALTGTRGPGLAWPRNRGEHMGSNDNGRAAGTVTDRSGRDADASFAAEMLRATQLLGLGCFREADSALEAAQRVAAGRRRAGGGGDRPGQPALLEPRRPGRRPPGARWRRLPADGSPLCRRPGRPAGGDAPVRRADRLRPHPVPRGAAAGAAPRPPPRPSASPSNCSLMDCTATSARSMPPGHPADDAPPSLSRMPWSAWPTASPGPSTGSTPRRSTAPIRRRTPATARCPWPRAYASCGPAGPGVPSPPSSSRRVVAAAPRPGPAPAGGPRGAGLRPGADRRRRRGRGRRRRRRPGPSSVRPHRPSSRWAGVTRGPPPPGAS